MPVIIKGVPINTGNIADVSLQIKNYIRIGGNHMIITANPEIVMLSKKDTLFNEILNKADIVTADGIGLILAAKILGKEIPSRVTGIDLVNRLFLMGSQEGYKFYFLGAREGVAEKAKAEVEKNYPQIKIVGTEYGYFESDHEVIQKIKSVQPDVLLVAMGMGKQEKWIWANKEKIGCPIYIGVGGSFDVLSGTVPRAPEWMRNLGLEWLFRLIQEPTRIKRMLVLPQFLLSVIYERLKFSPGGNND